MKRIEKLKVFSKRLLLHVAAQAIPGPAQLVYEVAQDFYQIFMVADDADRQALIEAACEMTDAERGSLIRELSQQFGQAEVQAIEGVLSTLRVRPQAHNALQRINQTMLSSSRQTLQPTAFSARQRAVGSAVVSSMLMPRQAHQGRAVHSSRWPQIDGFEIKNFLGQGSFAEVYLAHELDAQGEFKRSCALKVGDLHDIKRFNREVNALQHVQHENLIDYYGSGILQDPPPPRFWIAMPNLSGITLGDLMRGGLDVEQKLMLSIQVLGGLHALHEKKLSHRDLKPENALITDDFTLKLTDFGLSKSDGQEEHASLLTMGGDMLGTPAYMSPEQVKGVQSGMESDVWAFGVILYELFVGEQPFREALSEMFLLM
jgi:serine/threonine protein kinase